MPSIPALRESKPFTHIEALELDHVPEQVTAVLTGEGIEVVNNAKVREVQGTSGSLLRWNWTATAAPRV